MATSTKDAVTQKKLKAFVQRRHPEYHALRDHWDFLLATYEGGRAWFEDNIFKYRKEGSEEFDDRLKRAYRFNHTREVVDLVGKYLFKMEITRIGEVDPADSNATPEYIRAFWKRATLSGGSITDYMKRIANRTSVFGRIWIVVDRTKSEIEVKTVADEKKANVRTYSYFVPPQHVLDMSYDAEGELNWVLIYEVERDDEDPIESSGREIERFRLWTRTFSQVYEIKPKGNGKEFDVIVNEAVQHDLGIVPVFPADDVISDERYASPAMIADVAYLDRSVANYLSNIDAIVQDQTFSQLVIPAQGIEGDKDAYDKLVEMGTKRIFTYNADGGAAPQFISPDVKQAELILKIINKIINEIYHSVGLAGERTKEDNALGIDNSSGVAKAYDFERVNSLLASKADSLELIENKLVMLVAKWNGKDAPEEKLVKYPDNFDVRGLYDEFEIASRLSLIEAPEGVRREQMDSLISKLFPRLSKDLLQKMKDELKSWPPKPELEEPGSKGSGVLKPAKKDGSEGKKVS